MSRPSKFQSKGRSASRGHAENAAPLAYNSDWSTYPVPKTPTKNCIFCKKFHWSHLCLEVATFEKRLELFEIFGLCLLCGKKNHAGNCSYADIWCKWPQCGSKNEHNTTLCPNIEYPITKDMVRAYENHINYVWKLQEYPVDSFNDTSQSNQRKDRKRNRKLSSNAKTVTMGCHTKVT